LHLIFTGYPGTGKNTVAEMVGELYQKLGLLSHGRVNHYSRRDLVREGTAAEEQLVRQALKNSIGGILFVDQAGDLFHPEDPNDRGVIALGILYGILTREKPEVLVILSDIDEEMTVLLEAFPDLQKLFPRRLCFENYSPEELMEIARIKLEKLQFRFIPGAEEKFYKQLKIACRANEVDFTNGRYIDEQLEQASARMSARLMANRCGEYKKEDLMLITEEDIVTLPEGDPGKALEKLKAMIEDMNEERKKLKEQLAGIAPPEKLTKTQRKLWDYMRLHPEVTEFATIAKRTGLARNTVKKHYGMMKETLGNR